MGMVIIHSHRGNHVAGFSSFFSLFFRSRAIALYAADKLCFTMWSARSTWDDLHIQQIGNLGGSSWCTGLKKSSPINFWMDTLTRLAAGIYIIHVLLSDQVAPNKTLDFNIIVLIIDYLPEVWMAEQLFDCCALFWVFLQAAPFASIISHAMLNPQDKNGVWQSQVCVTCEVLHCMV